MMKNAESVAASLRRDVYIFSATFLFSGYQMTRLSSLSKSGKMAAPLGLGLSAFCLFSVKMSQSGHKAKVAKTA